MSFLSSLFSKKSKPALPKEEVQELDPKIRAALVLMKTTDEGMAAVDLLKSQKLIADPHVPFNTCYNPEKQSIYINTDMNPADIAVRLAGAARRIHHSQILSEKDMVEMKAADGVQCARVMEADVQAHEALMFYYLKTNDKLPYAPSNPDSLGTMAALFSKCAGKTDQEALSSAIGAYYNDHRAVADCDMIYTRKQHSFAYEMTVRQQNKDIKPFSKDMPEKMFEKICSSRGVPYVKQESFNKTPFKIMSKCRRGDIARMVSAFSKDVSITAMPTFEEVNARNAMVQKAVQSHR